MAFSFQSDFNQQPTLHGDGLKSLPLLISDREALAETVSEACFHITPTNHRSQIATTRLGAIFTHEADINLGGGAQRPRRYCITRESWNANDELTP